MVWYIIVALVFASVLIVMISWTEEEVSYDGATTAFGLVIFWPLTLIGAVLVVMYFVIKYVTLKVKRAMGK